MIDLTIFTPKGIELEGKFNHIQINDRICGSFGILSGHIPIISTITSGYIVLDSEKRIYVALAGAVFKLSNDKATIVSEMIAKGETAIEAESNLEKLLEKRKMENRQRNVELALAENELKKQVKKTKAGSL